MTDAKRTHAGKGPDLTDNRNGDLAPKPGTTRTGNDAAEGREATRGSGSRPDRPAKGRT